ncbi:MAG: helix-turn-helix domain-containing protein [Planctomycetia bacterium]|nr:helix-turn-helix domain-containing protein [Planctomycetia bacterium]
MTQLAGGDWLLLKEAAELIGISSATLSVIAKRNRIPHRRVGRQVMILKSDAEKFRDTPRKAGRPPTKPAPKKKRRK